MKTILNKVILLILFLSPFSFSQSKSSITVGLFDELSEIYPDTIVDNFSKSITIDAARGSVAAVHILVKGLNKSEVINFRVLDQKGKEAETGKWFRLIEVPVSENTGLDRATEKFSGKINPFVIRRAPFRIYEVLNPVSSPLKADSASIALRFEYSIDEDAKPGKYNFSILVNCGSKDEKLDVELNIFKAVIPPIEKSNIII